MNPQTLSSRSQRLEMLLESSGTNPVMDLLLQDSVQHVEGKGLTASNYDVFVIRQNEVVGQEIFGPKKMHIGNYSEEFLYGASGSHLVRFRSLIQALRGRAHGVTALKMDEIEYAHQVTLLWAEMGRLKDFLGLSPVISEIVAEFRIAQFQFIGKDTPLTVVHAIASGLDLIMEAKRLDARLVDQLVDLLEEAGIDSLAIDALRKSDA
jgi:hypothetical protein